ncbi:hypothetical protein E4T47_04410 [Aureobasidium subglaciale]|nr:hypothetical protein E4T47_04410 [Aureobasidium subglaciale]
MSVVFRHLISTCDDGFDGVQQLSARLGCIWFGVLARRFDWHGSCLGTAVMCGLDSAQPGSSTFVVTVRFGISDRSGRVSAVPRVKTHALPRLDLPNPNHLNSPLSRASVQRQLFLQFRHRPGARSLHLLRIHLILYLYIHTLSPLSHYTHLVMAPSMSKPSFMQLPPELRTLVYQHLLISVERGEVRTVSQKVLPTFVDSFEQATALCSIEGECIWCLSGRVHPVRQCHAIVNDHEKGSLVERPGGRIYPAILGCSKQVYSEAMPMLYSELHLSVLLRPYPGTLSGLSALPMFPCNLGSLNFAVAPLKHENSIDRRFFMQVVDNVMIALNGYRPGLITVIRDPMRGRSYDASVATAHEIFRKFDLMVVKQPIVKMSLTKRAALFKGISRDRQNDVALMAMSRKFRDRLNRRLMDNVPLILDQSVQLRQTGAGVGAEGDQLEVHVVSKIFVLPVTLRTSRKLIEEESG